MATFKEIETSELEQAIDTLNTLLWHILDDEQYGALVAAIEAVLGTQRSQMGQQGESAYPLSDAVDVAALALGAEVKRRKAEIKPDAKEREKRQLIRWLRAAMVQRTGRNYEHLNLETLDLASLRTFQHLLRDLNVERGIALQQRWTAPQ